MEIKAVVTDIMGTISPINLIDRLDEQFRRDGSKLIKDAVALNNERLLDEKHFLRGVFDSFMPVVATRTYVIEALVRDVADEIKARKFNSASMRLMGEINTIGLNQGAITGEIVFPDVNPLLEKLSVDGKKVATYSNGNAAFQRALLKRGGVNLCTIDHFFDTSGEFDSYGEAPKDHFSSYDRIAANTGINTYRIAYLSDSVKELLAAKKSGFKPILVERPGNAAVTDYKGERIKDFSELSVLLERLER